MEGSAVYLSFARRGASPPPQDVQVETHLSQVGGASLSRSRGRANGTENPVGCHPWRENEEGVKIIPAQNYAGVDTCSVRRLLPKNIPLFVRCCHCNHHCQEYPTSTAGLLLCKHAL